MNTGIIENSRGPYTIVSVSLFASLLSCISIMHNICFFQQSNEQLGWCDWMESVCDLNKEKGWWAKAVVARYGSKQEYKAWFCQSGWGYILIQGKQALVFACGTLRLDILVGAYTPPQILTCRLIHQAKRNHARNSNVVILVMEITTIM